MEAYAAIYVLELFDFICEYVCLQYVGVVGMLLKRIRFGYESSQQPKHPEYSRKSSKMVFGIALGIFCLSGFQSWHKEATLTNTVTLLVDMGSCSLWHGPVLI